MKKKLQIIILSIMIIAVTGCTTYVKEDKKNILGKDKKKREKINKTVGKCSNCGKEFTVEKIKKL